MFSSIMNSEMIVQHVGSHRDAVRQKGDMGPNLVPPPHNTPRGQNLPPPLPLYLGGEMIIQLVSSHRDAGRQEGDVGPC